MWIYGFISAFDEYDIICERPCFRTTIQKQCKQILMDMVNLYLIWKMFFIEDLTNRSIAG
jgi:hypothetical protein